MVVAQSVEWSLLTMEILGSNQVISKFLYRTFVSVNCIEKTKKRKRGLEWPISKNHSLGTPFNKSAPCEN